MGPKDKDGYYAEKCHFFNFCAVSQSARARKTTGWNPLSRTPGVPPSVPSPILLLKNDKIVYYMFLLVIRPVLNWCI